VKGEIHTGHCVPILKRLNEKIAHCVVTSPPYWSLRDYGESRKDQIGMEASPLDYIKHLEEVFFAVKRVLRDDGTLWVIIGDAYAYDRLPEVNAKGGDLLGLPWLFATAMRNQGWFVRYEGIWHKLSVTPSNTNNRPILAHEHIFMFTKIRSDYYYDQYAILSPKKSFPRSVWKIAVDKSRIDHSATFPIDLPLKIIKAGTSQAGCCSKCGKPYRRKLSFKNPVKPTQTYEQAARKLKRIGVGVQKKTIPRPEHSYFDNYRTTTGWEKPCRCRAKAKPCVVLDPFLGSGTSAIAAEILGREWIGIELFKKNVLLSRRRINSISVGTELMRTQNKVRSLGLSKRT